MSPGLIEKLSQRSQMIIIPQKEPKPKVVLYPPQEFVLLEAGKTAVLWPP